MLKPLMFETLLALLDGPRHGWALVRLVEARTSARLLPGNFYRTLRRMLAEGLIETAPAQRAEDDERRRYFQVTNKGRHIARDEAKRLQSLVRDKRTQKLLRAR
jgi:DNA-binding PadR family transcriptional regulator